MNSPAQHEQPDHNDQRDLNKTPDPLAGEEALLAQIRADRARATAVVSQQRGYYPTSHHPDVLRSQAAVMGMRYRMSRDQSK